MSLGHIALCYLIVGESLCVLIVSFSNVGARAKERGWDLLDGVVGSALFVIGWPLMVVNVLREGR